MYPGKRRAAAVAVTAAATVAPLLLSVATGAQAGAATRSNTAKISVHRVGTFRLAAGSGSSTELRPGPDSESADTGKAVANRSLRSKAKAVRNGTAVSTIDPSQPPLGVNVSASGFDGINHFQQRYEADGGNQWSLTPPDQALCSNGTEVVEGVNNAVAVYDTNGQSLTDLQSVNQLFWGDHEVLRPDIIASPHQMGDPSCVYDAGSDRYFLTVYDAVSDSAGNPTGPSFVDIAVSQPGTAIGQWTVFQLDTTNDGTDGTPNHAICDNGGCFGDYPHLATDAYGLYITTNEYPTFGPGYGAAQVYAISKSGLVDGSADVPGRQWDTSRMDFYQGTYYGGFTLAPAVVPGSHYATANGGTMYFLSSDSWSGDNPIVSHQILVWSIKHTSQLDGDVSQLRLRHTAVPVDTGYFPPPSADQKPGQLPLADCLNDAHCSRVLLGKPDKYKEHEYALDSSDTRMLQSAYANGKLWGALDTAVDVNGVTKAGVAYFVVDPSTMTTVKDGTIAVADNNITFPALGVTSAGKAVMALSLMGKDYYPSAAYVRLNDSPSTAASDVTVVAQGNSPADDFSGYRGYQYNRPRWGDYGAAAVVDNHVWIASEYIAAPPCSLAEFESTNFTCNNTRTALANWATHIAVVSTP